MTDPSDPQARPTQGDPAAGGPAGTGSPSKGMQHTVLAGLDQTLAAPSSRGSLGSDRELVLEVLSGGRRGLVKRCSGNEFRLGRRAHNDLAFDGKEDRAVSGNHLVLRLQEGSWWAEDLGSTNGTLLNGQPLTQAAPVNDEDVLELGRRLDMGTGGTVKLRLRLERQVGLAETGNLDEETKVRTEREAQQPAPAIPTTDAGDPPETLEPKPAGAPPIPTAPAAPIQAQVPAGELLGQLQETSLKLGKITYRLEDLLVSLAQQTLESDELQLDSLAGGPELQDSLDERAARAKERDEVLAALATHESQTQATLEPLQAECDQAAEALEAAKQAELEGRARSQTAKAAAEFLSQEARQGLRPLLKDLVAGLDQDAEPEGCPWEQWQGNLQRSAEWLAERQPDLENAAGEAARAGASLVSRQEDLEGAGTRLESARQELEQSTKAAALQLKQLEARAQELGADEDPDEEQEREALALFAAANLADGPPAFQQLTGFERARSLLLQRGELEREISALQARIQGN